MGFKLVGDVERVCQPNGEWNGTVPICQPLCHGMVATVVCQVANIKVQKCD